MANRPNILIIMTDEERFPPEYETEEVKQYREQHMPSRSRLLKQGVSFQRHYAAATACEPSRASFFTGQYPSLHGVTQTSGLAKNSSDPGLFWLPPNTVPTLGNYFRAGGYRTLYHGKWHISDQDLIVPGTNTALLSNAADGTSYPERIKQYQAANRLNQYGFDGWIGPEPHGALSNNSGMRRDPGFAQQAIDSLKQLNQQAVDDKNLPPWLMVCSFVNPHDIVFSGQGWTLLGLPSVPYSELPQFPAPPTANEDLTCKPRCQKDYVINYGNFYYPQPTHQRYRQLYYYLQSVVDGLIGSVVDTLDSYEALSQNTIVVFTSDHGEVLGSHGGMHQKWYNAYDETIRVPLIIRQPGGTAKTVNTPTSHVDLLPTLLELAGIDPETTRNTLSEAYTEARKLVGDSLVPLLDENPESERCIYFMTDDEVDQGLNEISVNKVVQQLASRKLINSDDNMESALGKAWNQTIVQQAYRPTIEPHHIETIVTRIEGVLYKYSRYFENPRFVGTAPGNPDGTVSQYHVPDEWELYNLDSDPYEEDNLLAPCCSNPPSEGLLAGLRKTLATERAKKRKLPKTLNKDAGMLQPSEQ
ncbi:MAG: sulfatase-like hydrolase/transferase [Methylobacter sp.]